MAARGAGAVGGALIAAVVTVLLTRRTSASRLTIVLAGVAVSSFFVAGMDVIVTLFPDTVFDRSAFFIGSFAMVTQRQIIWALPVLAAGTAGIFALAPKLDLFALGDDVASSLGVRAGVVRHMAISFAACLAAGGAEICGLLGFVGLVAPHIARRVNGESAGFATTAIITAVFGADLVLLCDSIARTVVAPYELPVGVFLSLIGAPFFIRLLLRANRRISG
jgi:iron complex transport system permease protein